MEFIKRHYEKVLLSVVLLGLAVMAALLPSRIEQNQRLIGDALKDIPKTGSAYAPANTASNLHSLGTFRHPPELALAKGHRLFAPRTWKQDTKGNVFPITDPDELAVNSLQVTKIQPLFLRLKFEGIAPGEGPRRYQVEITREADRDRTKRSQVDRPIALNTPFEDPAPLFVAREVEGPEENPTALVLFLAEDPNERVVLKKDEEWRSPRGFAADLRYDPAGKTAESSVRTFENQRVNDELTLNGRRYKKIVAITQNDVTVADPNGKPTTIALTKPQ